MNIATANTTDWNAVLANVQLTGLIILSLLVIAYVIQAILTSSLAHQKGYSWLAGFLLGLIVPFIGLIYEAGRPLSAEKEDERQRAHAREIARVLRRDVLSEDPQVIRRRV